MMNILESNNLRKKWYYLILCLFTFFSMPQVKAQDYNNPCFFCHMNIIVEMKVKASKHWEASVDCEACHGPSGEHVDVEDNSIKPDSVWTNEDVHNLCRRGELII